MKSRMFSPAPRNSFIHEFILPEFLFVAVQFEVTMWQQGYSAGVSSR